MLQNRLPWKYSNLKMNMLPIPILSIVTRDFYFLCTASSVYFCSKAKSQDDKSVSHNYLLNYEIEDFRIKLYDPYFLNLNTTPYLPQDVYSTSI